MAFQPPTTGRRPQISSIPTQSSQDQHESYHESPVSSTLSRHLLGALGEPEEQEWVVFSPSVTLGPSNSSITEIGTNIEHSELWTDGTESRLSGTRGQSYGEQTEEEEEEEDHIAYNGYEDDEDSLEPFREDQGIHPVLLPTHDGRGMFPSITSHEEGSVFMPGIASLEESLRLLTARNNIFDEADDLNSRIQKWRQEHSAAFIEEMEIVREQTRRRGSRTSTMRCSSEKEREEELVASMMLDEDDHREEPSVTPTEDGKSTIDAEKGNVEVMETFWRRVTRSLMRDIMGIDDRLLEVIFGESLPPSLTLAESDTRINNDIVGIKWERGLLETIARELGILLQQYTLHPTQGAFSTYSRWTFEQLPNPGTDYEAEGTKTPKPQSSHGEQALPNTSVSMVSLSEVDFQPTLSHPRQKSFSRHRAGMHSVTPNEDDRQRTAAEVRAEAQLRKEYWEQELGVRVFFSYLKSRFSSSPSSVSARVARKTGATMTAEPHKPIHHQHPLIQHQNQARRSTPESTHSGQSPMSTSWGLLGMGGYRNGSSCASQSTKTSRRTGKGKQAQGTAAGGGAAAATTVATSAGFYWEVETNVGSTGEGSCVGVGAWGEI